MANKQGTAIIGRNMIIGAASGGEPTVQTLEKEVVVARELAILGDYDQALTKFQQIYAVIYLYSKKYDYNAPQGGSSTKVGGGYAAQTASSQKKRQAFGAGAGNASSDAVGSPQTANAGDIFLFEKWNAFKKTLKKEFSVVV